jgi:hypothetical protein
MFHSSSSDVGGTNPDGVGLRGIGLRGIPVAPDTAVPRGSARTGQLDTAGRSAVNVPPVQSRYGDRSLVQQNAAGHRSASRCLAAKRPRGGSNRRCLGGAHAITTYCNLRTSRASDVRSTSLGTPPDVPGVPATPAVQWGSTLRSTSKQQVSNLMRFQRHRSMVPGALDWIWIRGRLLLSASHSRWPSCRQRQPRSARDLGFCRR